MQSIDAVSFHDRAEGGRRLGERLGGRIMRDPLILAIPRGGVVTYRFRGWANCILWRYFRIKFT